MKIRFSFAMSFFLLSLAALGGCSSDSTSSSEASDGGASTKETPKQTEPDTGNSPEGEEVFAASGTATANKLQGVWESPEVEDNAFTFVQRIRLESSSATFAVRCSSNGISAIAGATVRAKTSSEQLDILESASDTRVVSGLRCRLNAPRMSLQVCETPGQLQCFAVKGKTLTIYSTALGDSAQYTKVAD